MSEKLFHRSALSVALPSLALFAAVSRAATFTLTTADFATRQVDLRSLSADTLTIVDGGGESTMSVAQFLAASRSNASTSAAAAPFVLQLRGGGRIFGAPASLDEKAIHWSHPTLGEMAVPLTQVVSFAATKATLRDLPAGGDDVVALANGDAIRGIVSVIAADGVTVQPSAGDATKVPAASITQVQFAVVPGSEAASVKGFKVSLADGSTVPAKGLTIANATASLTLAGGATIRVPMDQIIGFEQVGGPVVWLSDLVPSENMQTPYFDQTPRPARFGATVDGRPIRNGGELSPHGIGVVSKSRLSFVIDPAAKTFRTRYALDGELPWADVDVRVIVDGKVVQEAKGVRAGKSSNVVTVEVSGAKTLTLEVDYGQNFDVQDRVNWLEPAFVK